MASVDAIRDPLYAKVRDAERHEPSIRGVLELLAGAEPTATDVATTHTARRVAADVNTRRGDELRAAFVAGSLTSREVVGHLGVQDRRAVAARRTRGTLLGLTLGNETYHPNWQFTATGTHPDLHAVLDALGELTSSVLAADRTMRRERDDLDGHSLADLLADGRTDLVVRLIRSVAA